MSSFERPTAAHRHLRIKSASAILSAGLLVPFLLLAGARRGTGQETKAPAGTAPQTWTAESHDRTNFPLAGKHRTLSCRECHVNLVFEGTPADCEACHWQRRQDDRYGLRLGMRCADCHTPQSWKKVDPSLWNHETATGFRLEGVHRTLDCEICHGASGFEPRPTDCYSCHQSDYQGTREPNHTQANFPTDCRTCHNQRSWEDASFSHTGFPLQGRHSTLQCSACHQNGVYAGTPTDCAACHSADYNNASDPNHRAAGFPTSCAGCHSPGHTSWDQATFNHAFPITAGRHSGLSCTDCHTTSDYRQFNCLDCHAHEKSAMDAKHQGRPGYAYNSAACLACHPRGNG